MANITHPAPDTIALAGEIDLNESPRVREALSTQLEQKPATLFVDLTEVSYMDSSGLAVLIEALQKAQSFSGKLAIYGLQPNVKTIFEIARLDQIFTLYADRTAAEA
ncbi:MAG: STAS domain-containing protein [Chthoniobacteraceae bacterium]